MWENTDQNNSEYTFHAVVICDILFFLMYGNWRFLNDSSRYLRDMKLKTENPVISQLDGNYFGVDYTSDLFAQA